MSSSGSLSPVGLTHSGILQLLPLSEPLLIIEAPSVPYQFARYFEELASLGGVYRDANQLLNQSEEDDDSYIYKWKDIISFFSFCHAGVYHHLFQDENTLDLYLIPSQES